MSLLDDAIAAADAFKAKLREIKNSDPPIVTDPPKLENLDAALDAADQFIMDNS